MSPYKNGDILGEVRGIRLLLYTIKDYQHGYLLFIYGTVEGTPFKKRAWKVKGHPEIYKLFKIFPRFYVVEGTINLKNTKVMSDQFQQLSINQRKVLFYCTKCQSTAYNSCLRHKQQIQKFYGTEIDKIPRKLLIQCRNCFRITSTTITEAEKTKTKCKFCHLEATHNQDRA